MNSCLSRLYVIKESISYVLSNLICFNDKIADGRVLPLQNIPPLLDVSGSLQRVFHTCSQGSPLAYSPIMLFCSIYYFLRGQVSVEAQWSLWSHMRTLSIRGLLLRKKKRIYWLVFCFVLFLLYVAEGEVISSLNLNLLISEIIYSIYRIFIRFT